MNTTGYLKQSDADLPDHIASYLAAKPVTPLLWIRMQDFWRGGEDNVQVIGGAA
jgi:hypothetical protein